MKINLGCGKDIRRGYINIDCIKFKGVDRVCNLNERLPFKDNSVEEVVLQDIIEHIENVPKFLLNIWGICCPNAKIFIRVPHFTSRNVWSDLEHKRGYNWDSFQTNKYIIDKFSVIKKRITFSKIKKMFEPVFNKIPRVYESWLRFPTAANLEVELKVIK